MAMTLRLPDDLAERGRRYAAELGISLNGLVAVALREYLAGRTEARTTSPGQVQTLPKAIARQVKAGPVRRRR
jgi:hypothetical protein